MYKPKGLFLWLHFSYNTIQYNTIQYNAIQYNTIQYHTIQCNAMQCNTIQCNTMQCNAMQYNPIPYHTIPCNAIQCNAMQYNALTLTVWETKVFKSFNNSHLIIIKRYKFGYIDIREICMRKKWRLYQRLIGQWRRNGSHSKLELCVSFVFYRLVRGLQCSGQI